MKRHLGELKWVRFLLSPGAPIWRMRRQSALHKLRRSAKHVAVPIVFWNRKYFAQELLSTFPEPPPPLVGNASPHGISLKRSNIAQTNRNMQKWKHSRYSTTFRILCLSQVGQPSALQCQTFPPGRARRHLSKSVPWSGKVVALLCHFPLLSACINAPPGNSSHCKTMIHRLFCKQEKGLRPTKILKTDFLRNHTSTSCPRFDEKVRWGKRVVDFVYPPVAHKRQAMHKALGNANELGFKSLSLRQRWSHVLRVCASLTAVD